MFCEHEEADDRIQFHLNHAVVADNIETAIVCSADTDVFVSMLYNYENTWHERSLQELWQLYNELVSPVQSAASVLGIENVKILPAIHALSGCDTTSNIGTKNKAFKMSKLNRFQVGLAKFGEDIVTEEIIELVEEFLIKALATNEVKAVGVKSFDAFRYFVFHIRKKNIELDILPC